MMGAGEAIIGMAVVGTALYVYVKQQKRQNTQVQPVFTPVRKETGPNFASIAGTFLSGLAPVVESRGFLNGLFSTGSTPTPAAPTSSVTIPPLPTVPGIGVTQPSFSQPAMTSIGPRLVNDLMRDFGLAKWQAAGIVGNLHVESAGFKTLQEITPMARVNGVLVPSTTARGGFGYAQWTGIRRNQFEKWVNDRGLDITSYEANYGFLAHEMTNTWEKRVVPKVRATATAEEAAEVFMKTFLRPGIPHLSARIDAARRYA